MKNKHNKTSIFESALRDHLYDFSSEEYDKKIQLFVPNKTKVPISTKIK